MTTAWDCRRIGAGVPHAETPCDYDANQGDVSTGPWHGKSTPVAAAATAQAPLANTPRLVPMQAHRLKSRCAPQLVAVKVAQPRRPSSMTRVAGRGMFATRAGPRLFRAGGPLPGAGAERVLPPSEDEQVVPAGSAAKPGVWP
jgi:hypothetical protein